MLKRTQSIVAALLCVASSVELFAGNQLFDFESDPTGVPGFVLYGNHATSAYQFFDGNPGGYLQLTEAAGSQNCGILFPDVDLYTNSLGEVVSMPVKAFTISLDLRAGNGTRHPADGFSINFVRQTDPALERALRNPPNFSGWAGGDSLAATADRGDTGNPESGVHDGLSVCFDTWAGNWLPVNGVISNSASANDIEGIYIRLDDVTIDSNPFPSASTTWNGGCYINEANPGDPCGATVLTNQLTMQTGPWTGTGANDASDGTYTSLGWARVTMEVNELKQVTVTYKGRLLLDKLQLANYPTSQGRLLLACRTGGSWQHTHIDNVQINTVPSVQPVFQGVTGGTNSFRINILNIAAAQTTNFPFVSLDGVDVTSQIVVSNYLDISTHGLYSQAARFAPNSSHAVVVHFQDALGQRFTNSANFVVPRWITLDPSTAIPLAQVDTAQPGFKVKSYQGIRFQPNQLRWTEEQVIGLRGANIANQTGATGGFFTWDGVPRFSNGAGGTLFPGTPNVWTTFGIGLGPVASASDSAVEMFTYLYFPVAGTYNMYVGSDDGFRISTAAHPMDRMGSVFGEFDGGRGLGEPGDQMLVIVGQPGCYPIRMLWENGTGPDSSNGANLQWLTEENGTYSLVNEVGNPASVLAYREVLPAASLGAYVISANPVRDAQNVVFYQPIVVELGNGTGSRTVNQGTIVLAVDGTNQTLAVTSPSAGVTRIVSQMGGNVWSVGRHTNVLTFTDNAGGNYNYTWPFTVINVQPTNVISIPLANMAPAGSVDVNQKGFRVRSYQTPYENPNHVSWTEMQLQGLKGPNVAFQSNTNGPGWHAWQNNDNGGEGDGILDLRYSNNADGGRGEWGYSTLFSDPFGIGNNTSWTGTGESAYRFNYAANKGESSALDIGTWLVFPAAGTYIIHVNSDDGCKMIAPVGYPFNKLGQVLTEANVGRGVQGASGAQVGGDYCAISIPAPGAYPFRVVYENGGTDGGIEWSAYQFRTDGGVAKMPINEYRNPQSIKAYQTLTTGDVTAPYVSYANPPHNHQETAYWQPLVVELTDGGGKTVNQNTIQLTVDGVVRPVIKSSPSAGVTRIVQDIGASTWTPGAHTAVLTFSDNSSGNYSYSWPFTVMNLTPVVNNQPGVVVDVPASSAVPVGTVNTNPPGFRVYVYQSGTQGIGNIEEAERAFLGERGANIATVDPAGYYVHNDVVDFADGYNHIPGFTGYDTDAQNGEFRYNYPFSRFGGVQKGGAVDTNDIALIFAGYMEFDKAGRYAMTVNSDDGFKVTVPFNNPRSQTGTLLGWFNGGRGNTGGGGFGPRGSVTHFVFNIPAPGAYPIRLLWQNGGGGLNVEWTLYRFLADGSVARTIVGDTNAPGVKVYQDSGLSGPFVTSMNPAIPYTLVAEGLQVMTLDRGGNIVINLRDGNTTVDTSQISLTVNGVAQTLDITQPGGGVTTITRLGSNLLPSGAYGPAVLTYKDNAGRTYTVEWTLLSRHFYGTLLGGYPLGSGDPAKPGFLWRTFKVDGAGSVNMPTRLQAAEQVLAGLWTNNHANLAGTVNGYFVLTGVGEGGTNGLINFNQDAPGNAGGFNAGNGFTDQFIPGISTANGTARQTDSIAGEALTYIEFPASGDYTFGVSSDDGFRVTRGWGAPNEMGTLIVHSPAGVAGTKAAVINSQASRLFSSPITGQIVQALGTGNGSTDPAQACAITNGAQLAGKIALIYRGTCGFNAKVANAAAAGAIAVIMVQDRPVATPADGWFPTEMGIQPIQDIPAIMIKRSDGDAIVAALAGNTVAVNATLTPFDDEVNPPANSPVLGQADYGKGASDILFNVTVPEAGVYPVRLLWMEGGGGANCEWFYSPDGGTTKFLVNDPLGVKAFYGVTVLPEVSLTVSGNNVTVDYTGTLEMADAVTGPWTAVYGQPPFTMSVSQAAQRFFRSR